MPACEMDGYEESSPVGGPRANPYRADLPPWQMLDRVDPVQKAMDEAAAAVQTGASYIIPAPEAI